MKLILFLLANAGELFAPYSIINAYNMTLRYRSKVKLHGMNCGIVINQGEIKLQSRNMFMDGSVQGTSFCLILFVHINNIITYIVALTSVIVRQQGKGQIFRLRRVGLETERFLLVARRTHQKATQACRWRTHHFVWWMVRFSRSKR